MRRMLFTLAGLLLSLPAVDVKAQSGGATWMTSTQFRQEVEHRSLDGLYPSEVHAECRGAVGAFRARWTAAPAQSTYHAFVDMTQELYERRDAEFRAKG